MVTIVAVFEAIWLIVYLNMLSSISFTLYVAVAITIAIVGIVIWHFWSVRTVAEEKRCIEKYGCILDKEAIKKIERDPRRRNQKRGRGPRNGNLDPESCEICGSLVKQPPNDHFFWQTKHLCYACEQRYKEAQEKGIIPHIAGYTDNKEHGESNQRELWVKQQIAALDLRDGVIDEATARAEVRAAEEAGKQWAAEQKVMKERERRQQIAAQRDEEGKSRLNEDVQCLLN